MMDARVVRSMFDGLHYYITLMKNLMIHSRKLRKEMNGERKRLRIKCLVDVRIREEYKQKVAGAYNDEWEDVGGDASVQKDF